MLQEPLVPSHELSVPSSQRSQSADTTLLSYLTLTSPSRVAAFFNEARRLCVAVLSAPILPLSFIDPVLSRPSATRSRVLPHLTDDDVDRFICGTPTMPMKSDLTLAVTTTVSDEPLAVP